MNRLILTNKQSYYKYSSSGSFKKQEKGISLKNSKQRSPSFIKKALGVSGIAILLFCCIIFYIYQSVQIDDYDYQIAAAEKKLNQINLENQNLRLQIAERQSLYQIESKAKERYGMVEADEFYYLSLEKPQKIDEEIDREPVNANKSLTMIVYEVTDWIKNLTSVEAGTLD